MIAKQPSFEYRKITGHKYCTRRDLVFDIGICPTREAVSPGGWVRLATDGKLYIKAHYSWNGASGGMWDSPNVMGPSLAHDALYQLFRERALSQFYRPAADTVFRDFCLQKKMSDVRAGYAYRLLRMFGDKAARAYRRGRKIWLTAP